MFYALVFTTRREYIITHYSRRQRKNVTVCLCYDRCFFVFFESRQQQDDSRGKQYYLFRNRRVSYTTFVMYRRTLVCRLQRRFEGKFFLAHKNRFRPASTRTQPFKLVDADSITTRNTARVHYCYNITSAYHLDGSSANTSYCWIFVNLFIYFKSLIRMIKVRDRPRSRWILSPMYAVYVIWVPHVWIIFPRNTGSRNWFQKSRTVKIACNDIGGTNKKKKNVSLYSIWWCFMKTIFFPRST